MLSKCHPNTAIKTKVQVKISFSEWKTKSIAFVPETSQQTLRYTPFR